MNVYLVTKKTFKIFQDESHKQVNFDLRNFLVIFYLNNTYSGTSLNPIFPIIIRKILCILIYKQKSRVCILVRVYIFYKIREYIIGV